MKIETLKKSLDYTLWTVFIILAITGLYFVDDWRKQEINRFVVPEKTETYNYTYTNDDGKKARSTYKLAWYYKPFHREPEIALYDQARNVGYSIDASTIDNYKTKLGQPAWPSIVMLSWYYLWDSAVQGGKPGGLMLLALFLIPAGIYYLAGISTRNIILYIYATIRDDFASYAYYSSYIKRPFKKRVNKHLVRTIDTYINNKKVTLANQYNANYVQLLLDFLAQCKQNNSTTIDFYLYYLDKVINHRKHMSDLLEKHYNDVPFRNFVKERQMKEYTVNEIHIPEKQCAKAVEEALDDLFVRLMGDRVLKFKAIKIPKTIDELRPNSIYIRTIFSNSLGIVTRSHPEYEDQHFFCLDIRLAIYHYQGNKNFKTLWEGKLKENIKSDALKDYFDSDSSANINNIYDRMVTDTMKSLPDLFKPQQ